MALTQKPNYIKEPTDLQCGQAVLAMLCDKSAEDIVNLLQNEKETTLKEMFYVLEKYGISYDNKRKEVIVTSKDDSKTYVISFGSKLRVKDGDVE